MKKLLYTLLGGCLSACAPGQQANNATDELTMLIGTYTTGNSKGIYTFRFNQETGKAVALDSLEMTNPSFLTLSADERMVYAVSETSDSTASLLALKFDAQQGKLFLLNSQPTQGGDPCYTASNGRIAVTANYGGGNISVFPLREDGGLQPVELLMPGSIGGPDARRQAAAHVHCTYFTPDGRYLLATDFSADRLLCYKLDTEKGIPLPNPSVTPIAADSGPRHLTFSPDGKFLYLINELSGRVILFAYDNGTLTEVQSIEGDAASGRGSADIHLSPDGKFLYTSNRLKEDGIAIFAVDTASGKLTKTGYQLTGIHPRNFGITPNGKFLLVACRDNNAIQIYQRDATTGLLTDIHQDISVDKPVCIQFAGLVNNP